jgi:hypothetical protein
MKVVYMLNSMSRDSVVGIATGYGLDEKGFGVRAPVGTLLHVVQTGSGVHPAFLSSEYGGSFPGGKATEA